MPACVYQGEVVGTSLFDCCGGKRTELQIYRCLCTAVESEFCVPEKVPKRQQKGKLLHKDGEEFEAFMTCCVRCRQRLLEIPQPDQERRREILEAKPTHRRWLERRRLREEGRVKAADGAVLFDCDPHGTGDAVVACWLAEGTKRKPRRLLVCGDKKKEILELFGQESCRKPGAPVGMAGNDRRAKGVPPRLWDWAEALGLDLTVVRPRHTLADGEISRPPFVSEVLLFPETHSGDREWPQPYWDELHKSLDSLVVREDDGYPWRRVAAAMLRSRLVISADSGPLHVAGTLGVPCIGIFGPTTPSVVSHMESVRAIQAEKRLMPCSGCFWGWRYGDHCQYSCAALSSIMPEDVYSLAKGILGGTA